MGLGVRVNEAGIGVVRVNFFANWAGWRVHRLRQPVDGIGLSVFWLDRYVVAGCVMWRLRGLRRVRRRKLRLRWLSVGLVLRQLTVRLRQMLPAARLRRVLWQRGLRH